MVRKSGGYITLNDASIGIIITSVITVSSIALLFILGYISNVGNLTSMLPANTGNYNTADSSNITKPIKEVDFSKLISGWSKISDFYIKGSPQLYTSPAIISLDYYFTAVNGFKDIRLVIDGSTPNQSIYEFVLYPNTTASFTVLYDASYSLAGGSTGLRAITWPKEFNRENLLKELGSVKVYKVYLNPYRNYSMRNEDVTEANYLQVYITSLDIIDDRHAKLTYTIKAVKEGIYFIDISHRIGEYITVGYRAYEY